MRNTKPSEPPKSPTLLAIWNWNVVENSEPTNCFSAVYQAAPSWLPTAGVSRSRLSAVIAASPSRLKVLESLKSAKLKPASSARSSSRSSSSRRRREWEFWSMRAEERLRGRERVAEGMGNVLGEKGFRFKVQGSRLKLTEASAGEA